MSTPDAAALIAGLHTTTTKDDAHRLTQQLQAHDVADRILGRTTP